MLHGEQSSKSFDAYGRVVENGVATMNEVVEVVPRK